MKVEGPKFRLWFDPGISDAEFDEMASALCKIIVCGKPQSPKHRRAVAIRQAMAQYQGARSTRANGLPPGINPISRQAGHASAAWKACMRTSIPIKCWMRPKPYRPEDTLNFDVNERGASPSEGRLLPLARGGAVR